MPTPVESISQFIESMSQYIYRFDDPETASDRDAASNWVDANVERDDEDVLRLLMEVQDSDLPPSDGYTLGFDEGDVALREISTFPHRGGGWGTWFRHFVASETAGLHRWQAEQSSTRDQPRNWE